jgi:2-oxoglutarate ferredoxin oxidoreductase subunit beta
MPTLPVVTAEDLATEQEVRWCPGCGDFSILAQLKQVLAGTGVPRENIVFISGIGCSSRLPYYMNTYGFHGIQGRSFALATGLKIANPGLQVWVITGDGDGLSAGTNYLVHALRRNVDIKILLLNNEVFGLTRGQYSPTSRPGTRTTSSPDGSLDTPLRPLTLALAAEATFVARTIDVDVNHLTEVLRRAAAHKGAAFVEIYQNCKVFNDGVFDYATDKSVKAEHALYLEHGRPLLFGKDRNLGICLNGLTPEIVTVGNGVTIDDLIIHDERAEELTPAFLLSRLVFPDFPESLGVLRAVDKPTYESLVRPQAAQARAAKPAKLDRLLAGDDSWTVQ